MKNVWKSLNWKMLFTFLVFTCLQTVLWAQDSGSSTTTSSKNVDVSTTHSDNWYASPWVWVIGAAVFILLLVALLSGGRGGSASSTDRVTVTKTVERDSDV